MLTLRPKPATSQAPVVVPMLAPKMIPIPAISGSSPALRNEMVITDTNELDCISVVEDDAEAHRLPQPVGRGFERTLQIAAAEQTETLFHQQHTEQEDRDPGADYLEVRAEPEPEDQEAQNGRKGELPKHGDVAGAAPGHRRAKGSWQQHPAQHVVEQRRQDGRDRHRDDPGRDNLEQRRALDELPAIGLAQLPPVLVRQHSFRTQ